MFYTYTFVVVLELLMSMVLSQVRKTFFFIFGENNGEIIGTMNYLNITHCDICCCCCL